MKILLAVLLLLGMQSQGWAVSVDKTASPVIETRLHIMAEELRCLVCQNTTLASSEADLAIDLRNEIRELMQKGDTDQQIVAYLVQRYGDFVRYRPPLEPLTIPLWFGPLILVVLGMLLLIVYLRRLSAKANNTSLSVSEQQRLSNLLNNNARDRDT